MSEQPAMTLQTQRAAIEHALDGIAILASDETYLYMNDAHAKIYGYDQAEDLVGRTWRVLYDEDEAVRIVQVCFSVLRAEGRWSGTLKGKQRDGSPIDVDVSLTLIEDGKVICACRDVTAHKRIGEALQAVTEATAAVTGRDYLRSLVQHLAAAFQTKVAFVTECVDPSRTHARTLALMQNGEFLENVEYELTETPCAGVIAGDVCYYPNRLAERFPREAGHESYLGVPILNAAGQALGHLAVVDDKPMHREPQDVSIMKIFATRVGAELERIRAEEALRKSEERFRSGFEHAPIGMAMTGIDGRFLLVNRALCNMLGFTKDELEGGTFQSITVPEDIDAGVRLIQEIVQGKRTSFQLEKRYRHKQGRVVWARTTASVVRDLDGKPWYLFAQIQDITEHKYAEEALHRSAKRLEILQEIDRAILVAHSPTAIAQAALRHIQHLIPCLRASVVLFDFEHDRAVLMAIHVRGETQVGTAAPLTLEAFGVAESLRHGRAQVVDDIRALPDPPQAIETLGKEGLRSFIKVPLLAQGELIGALNLGSDQRAAFTNEYVAIAREIANSLAVAMHQAYLHEQVERHAIELEQRVAERTAELEAFSYSVSHDLRTPLLTIDGFSRMLLEDHTDALDAEGRRQLQVICNNAEKMSQLIDDLLAFSRIGRREMVASRIDMERLAETVFDELRTATPERTLHLEVHAMPPAFGDQAMVGQVFTNLLSNAIKFSRPRAAAVIDVGAETDGGETVYYVRDNGVGFDTTYADKLFGVFQRLHSDEEFEGTGVGLAIVQRIILRHGGRVWAASEVGEGTTIYFTLSSMGGTA